MDDESRKTLFEQTPFWMVVMAIVVFAGCILLMTTTLDIEALIQLEEGLFLLEELLDRVTMGQFEPGIEQPGPTAVPVHIILPTPTP